jgi:hypothetical protein
MFNIVLKDQKLPGYKELITVEVSVVALQITEGNLQAQWSIKLPESGPRLPGALPPAPLFSGSFDMPPPPAIMAGLGAFFQASAPNLVAGLLVKAEAAAAASAFPKTT